MTFMNAASGLRVRWKAPIVAGAALTALMATGAARAAVCGNLAAPSPNLTLINQVDGTTILDHDATRILFASASGIAIKSRVDGTVTVIAPGPNASTYGHLLAGGAIWQGGRWIGGVLDARGAAPVYGDWARVSGGVEHLATGIVTPINRPPGFVSDVYASSSLDASGLSGTVALGGWVSGGYQIHTLATSGVVTPITVGIFPILDGGNLVHTWHGGSIAWPPILLRTASGTETLSVMDTAFLGPSSGGPRPGRDYAVRGGWVAYTKIVGPSATRTLEVWTRAPDGTSAKASTHTYVQLAGMNDAGEVVVDRFDRAAAGRPFIGRALSKADSAGNPTAPLDLGSVRGEMRWVDGAWYEYVGCALFEVGPSAEDPGSGIPGGGDGDAGSSDAGGAPDAGSDGSSDAGVDGDAAAGLDAGASSGDGGSSVSAGEGASSGSSSSPSGGAEGASASGTSSGPSAGTGGCTLNVRRRSTEGFVTLTALAGLVLVVARRRCR